MERKVIPIDLGNIRDSVEARYAAKHFMESGINFHGQVFTKHFREGKLIHECDQGGNIFTTQGMNYMLEVMFGTTSKAGSAIFYVGIFKNNVTPALADTASVKLGAAGTYGECQDADYDSPLTNKPSYTIAAAASGSCTNSASPASFTMAQSITVYGAFLSTDPAKTATTGYLMCAKKFTTARAVIDNDVLSINYTISCTST
ncbi:MAG: hypothetical protein PHV90_10020 [Smithella sp.]|jgi:hypothetical protein|nr:hypothetical protein [Methanosarcina virus MetMV]MDD5525561.1 hypothetical protein [Smithella sp.]